MSSKEAPTPKESILRNFEGRPYVIADTFIVREPNPSDKKRKAEVEKQIMVALKALKNLNPNEQANSFILGFSQSYLQEMYQTLREMISKNDPRTNIINPQKLTFILLNAKHHQEITTDQQTGLSFAAIQKGKIAFPMHPTPAS